MFQEIKIYPGSISLPQLEFSALSQKIQQLVAMQENYRPSDHRLGLIALEKEVQLALNRGEVVTDSDLQRLHSAGYAISHHAETLSRFAGFVFREDVELAQAIQTATPEGGLLVDGFKMYRPGPCSASAVAGAAKGYDEIFAVFENQTTEKRNIGNITHLLIHRMERSLPENHPWKGNKTILDLACGNGVQSGKICREGWMLIGLDNQAPSIEKCKQLLPSRPAIRGA